MKKTFSLKPILLYTLIGLVTNVILFILLKAFGIYPTDFYVEEAQGPITEIHIAISSTLPTVIGALLAFLLNKFVPNGKLIFIVIAVLFTLISFAGPYGIKDASNGVILGLNLLHVTTAIFITTGAVKSMK